MHNYSLIEISRFRLWVTLLLNYTIFSLKMKFDTPVSDMTGPGTRCTSITSGAKKLSMVTLI